MQAFQILGTIVAQPKLAWVDQYKNKQAWLKFQGVDGLVVVGTELGTLDGHGDTWWDITMAFEGAWAAACNQQAESVKLRVPTRKKYLVYPIEFGGPCKSNKLTFEILGFIVAQPRLAWGDKNKNKNTWLKFRGVNGLSVVGYGLGQIDGQGSTWWRMVDDRPNAMVFSLCNNLRISGLTHINSPKFHLAIVRSDNAQISKLRIIAPSNSPNTDGIDLLSSTNINIRNCTMQTGDDCIAIKGGTSKVIISDIICGPGHGISIGSLGEFGRRDEVEAIDISNCNITGADDGIRIKTWQGGSGFARNINFTNIFFTMVKNPVAFIDQFYCPNKKICLESTSAVQVSDIRFTGLTGTSTTKREMIAFRCSTAVPCTNIIVNGVDIKPIDGGQARSACMNVRGFASNVASPPLDCLQP
ncbi:probable polygalacturonase At3g15720 [Salvia hispanica]|uniref:probable polygalacturonase At3g15720 n=1 Tax=Salvia hispanica TaxID=49212 RepID=UPI0020092F8A|nr:probable polygalacturonase At3g15720 [Salvia hispanica]